MKRWVQLFRNLPAECVHTTFDSPVGRLWLVASEDGLHAVLWEAEQTQASCQQHCTDHAPHHPVLREAASQLEAYFTGKLRTFRVPLCWAGTPFQQASWEVLCTIPYGQTLSYREQATRLGDPNKARAVGAANARNPLPIFVPCHRVLGVGKTLTGFAGGLATKQRLLALEGVVC